MPITALLDLQLKPGSLDEGYRVTHEVLAATRAFPGCMGVDVMIDTTDLLPLVINVSGHLTSYRSFKWPRTLITAAAMGPRRAAGEAGPARQRRAIAGSTVATVAIPGSDCG